MTNENIFITQILSIVGYISTVFFIYRLLVKKKDATIEYLEIKNIEKDKIISELSKKSEDVLLKSLDERIDINQKEISRLVKDKTKNDKEIERLKVKIENLESEIITTKLEDPEGHIFCRICGASLIDWGQGLSRGDNPDRIEDQFSYLQFECGAKIENGKDIVECPFIDD